MVAPNSQVLNGFAVVQRRATEHGGPIFLGLMPHFQTALDKQREFGPSTEITFGSYVLTPGEAGRFVETAMPHA